MASHLEDCLQSLHSLLQQPQSSVKEQIEVVIEDIKSVFQEDITDKDLDLTCSLLFDKEKGIIRFLHDTASSEEFQNAKAGSLDFLGTLIERVDKQILPFASDLKDIIISVYSRDRFAKVKNASLSLLVKLLYVSAGSSHAEDLKVESLIPKFFLELTKASKLSASVKANIYNLLGVIAEVHPNFMVSYSERLAGLYINALKAEMMGKTKKPELSIVAGCLEGLAAFMLNFTQSADEDSKHSYEIFKYVRMAIDPKIPFTRYEVPRAGLKLIAKHAEQFRPYLLDDYQALFEKLDSWCRHHNRELLHMGLAALTSFLKEISAALVERAKEGTKEGAIFKFFLLNFRNVMKDKDSTAKHVSMAVTGYGLLAAPCRSFLTEADTQFMLGEVISMCEHQFLGPSTAEFEDRFVPLPNYLKALANIIRQLDSVSISYCVVLERLLILLLENFPSVSKAQQFLYTTTWLRLMLTLAEKATVYQTILHATVYQGLIRTCSHRTSYESAQTKTGIPDVVMEEYEKQVSYKDFVSFWQGLLNSTNAKELAHEDFTVADRQSLAENIYNEIITSVLKILSKLDLNATCQQELDKEDADDTLDELASADPTFGISATKPVDFQVLINMVDLCKDLLVDGHCLLFHPWVYTFCQNLVVLATRYPLVSGLYKLLTVAVTVARKINYFEGMGEPELSKAVIDERSEPSKNTEKMLTCELIKRFSKEVLVRMKQYKDDLLASCLTLILAMPKEIISDLMADIIPAIQKTFDIGLSYLPLALVGLEALESWKEHLPNSLLEPYYADLLPCLDPYLQTEENASDEAIPDTTPAQVSKRSKKKIPMRLLREKKAIEKMNSDSLLSTVKRRILIYLGSLGGSINHNLLAHTDNIISEEAIAWDSQKHLRFDFPFFDMKPTIYFDPFLPRIVHLAGTSSDRPTKVAACELLHSLILFAVGRGAQLPGEAQKRSPMALLYRKLFPPLLSLACDVEQVCQDLFQPLVMQLIHWFTSNKMAESPETMALLDAIYDGLIQQSDMALRDFSARCLKEFLHWSLKQISQKAARNNPINAKSVMKRMFSFSLHPNAFKRFGAALAFNNIYMVFREENELVSRFTFDILAHFVDSLAMAHKDPKYLGTQEQCVNALLHLERIISVKADLLKNDPGPKQRPEPNSWSSRKLENGIRWLTRQCGRPETECRHTCMKLVFTLCTLLRGLKSPSDYFNVLYKNGGSRYFIERFEGGGDGTKGLLAFPTLLDVKGSPLTFPKVMEWIDNLLAALDCYCWLFDQGLLSPVQMFTEKGSELSSVFKSLTFFLDKVALNGLEAVIPSKRSHLMLFTPLEIEEFSRGKCTVIIRLWNFLSILLRKHAATINKFLPNEVWTDKLWTLTAECILRPHAVGFNMADTETISQLPKEMDVVLMVVGKYLPERQKKQFASCLTNHLNTFCNLPALLPINLDDEESDRASLVYMVQGYQQLQGASYIAKHLPGLRDGASFAKSLLDNVFHGIVQEEMGSKKIVKLSPTSKNLANSLLSLAFLVEVPTDSLIPLLMENTKVGSNSHNTVICHGDWFFSCLRPTLLDYFITSKKDNVSMLCNQASKDSERVSAILVAILDHVGRDRSLRKKEGPIVCDAVLGQWKKLEILWTKGSTLQTQKLAFGILSKILLVDSQVASNENHHHFLPVFEMYISLLTDRNSPLSFKNEILSLMPFFASVTKAKEDKFKNALNQFVADTFPHKSSELTPGTTNYNDYISALNKLLVAMEMTGSLVLLELIISIVCKEQQHCHLAAMQESIGRLVQRLLSANQKPALDVAYNIFTKEECFAPDIRRIAIENVCLHMLQFATTACVVEFFSDHILELVQHLDSKLKSTESALEVQLTNKIGTFQLLERMYSRLNKEEVNTKSSTINLKFCQGKADTGKEMTMKITRAAQEAKSEDVRGDTMLCELRRQYHCFAYNLLITIVSCVQTDMKFYKGFLFQDNPAKGQFLLENIISKEKRYEFTAELQAPLERHQKFISLRKEVKDQNLTDSQKERMSPESVTPSLHLASQYLADSSLSDDLSQYDFNQHASGQSSSGVPRKKLKSSPSESEGTESSVTANNLVLEMDDLNRHECMAPLMGLLQHMQHCGVSPQVSKGEIPKDMPVWMVYLHEKMTASSAHVNCKIFIAKLIINCSQIFQPYSKFWFRPLIELMFLPEVSSQGLTYFMVDLIVAMVSWQSVAIPQEKAMVSRLVRQLVCGIHHPNRQVFRNNLELLKTMLECWHTQVDIPYNDIYNYLKDSEATGTQCTIGLQVLGVVVSNKFAAYGPSASVDKDRYFNVLCKLMSHRLKQVHAASAEVLGMVLYKAAQSSDKELEESVLDQVVTHLSGVAQQRGDNFVVCVHKIHGTYTSITKRLVSKLLFILPNLHGELRSKCLEVLHSHVPELENAYVELMGKGLPEFLTHRDEVTQLVALRIVQSLMVKMDKKQLDSLIHLVVGFSSHPSILCRKVMLDILMWVFDNYRYDEDDISLKIMMVTKETLLKGLCDKELECRLICHNFWSSNMRLSEGTLDRTISLLEAMYSTTTENHFLAYATNLLLESTSKSPDYQRLIFENPLSECKFQEYSVQSSWHQRHAAMTPLFAVTLASQSQSNDGWSEDDSMEGDLRATMDTRQFTATMDATAGGKAFNWLTQSSLDTFMEVDSIGRDTSQLLFTLGDGASPRSKVKLPSSKKTFALKSTRAGQEGPSSHADSGTSSKFSDIWRLKRRFLKDKVTQAAYHGKRMIRLKKMEEHARLEQKARRENEVTLYRKYRKGDLPDIQIKYQYIIAPLQALAHKDNKIASLLFSALFKAVFSEIDTVKTEREKGDVIAQIKKSMENILSQTTHYFPPFITAVLDILYHLKATIQVSPSDMATCAIVSGQQNLGILLLEEQLIQMDDIRAPSSKRARSSKQTAVNPDTAKWIEMCRLFKSVHEYDALQGILSDRLGTKEITRHAVEAEARGDFKAARLFYEEATSCTNWQDEEDPLECEEDFWDEGRMECLNNLCQWSDLETVSVSGVDNSDTQNLERVWDDPFYQERYLPYVVRSKVKLLLEGDQSQQTFLSFVDKAMTETYKRTHLQSRYSQEMALMSLWQGDYNRARHFASLSFDKFIQDWMSVTPMMALSRKDNLCHLQALVEMQEFLNAMSREGSRRQQPIHQTWQSRSPHPFLNPIPVWDDIATNRSLYLDLMSQQPHSEPSTSQDASMSVDLEINSAMEEAQTNLWLAMADSCRRQNNLALTLKLLKKTHATCKKISGPACFSSWTVIYSLTHHAKAKATSHPWPGEVFANIVSTMDQLVKLKDNARLDTRPDYKVWARVLLGQAFDILTQGLSEIDSLESLGQTVLSKLCNHVSNTGHKERVIKETVTKGFDHLKSATSDGEVSMPNGTQAVMGVEKASLDLAKYCDKYLQLLDAEKIPSDLDLRIFPQTMVECLLGAIKGGSLEARERFPSLLQILGQYSQVHSTFKSKTADIPSWMFLMWMSQMTALMDKPEGAVVLPILERIAGEFPQAVVYPFYMSFEGLVFGNSSQDKKNKESVERIAALINIPIVNRFISALEQFSSPFMVFKDWIDEIRKLHASGDKKKIKSCYAKMYASLFLDKSQASESAQDTLSSLGSSTSVGMGVYRKEFSSLFKTQFDQAFGKDGDKLAMMSSNEFSKAFKKVYGNCEVQKSKLQAPSKLKDYCPWLADFTLTKHGKTLEIPGQYTGLKKPLPEYHVYVTGFAGDVLVLASLRQPKRIIVRGNDEQDHPYLVKGGEDLRLDQRIQNLFYIMNQVMKADPACCQRKLQLVTYQVIPMTPRLGLIQWLSNTRVLKEFYINAMSNEEKKGVMVPQQQHQIWTNKAAPNKKNPTHQDVYDGVYLKYNSTETIREFRNKEAKIPWDLSRRALKQMSSSAAAFHVLRNRLVTSHATVCICHYLLGIGDRHLGNFMVNTKTGHMIGIDFGHAFGTATQFLPVPELIPFRLTSQLVNLTLPMQAKGLMEGTMRHVLRAMRDDCDLLFSTMDVFIKEPSMDWLIFADKQIKQQGLPEDSMEATEKSWYPRQKIEIAKSKLEGNHPSHIMKEELHCSGLVKREAFKKYVEVLMGSSDQVRGQLPDKRLSVEDQVAALISQATDPNVLGRVYVGWNSWM